jgi:hypothetical protein
MVPDEPLVKPEAAAAAEAKAADEAAAPGARLLLEEAPEPRQQELPEMPTQFERDATQAKIDRAKLGEVETILKREGWKPRALTANEIRELAGELGVPEETAKAYFTKGREMRLPEEYVKGELRREAEWARTGDVPGEISQALQEGKLLPANLTPDDVALLREHWEGRTDLSDEQKGLAEAIANRVFAEHKEVLEIASDFLPKDVQMSLMDRYVTAMAEAKGNYIPLTRALDDFSKALKDAGVEITVQPVVKRLEGSMLDTLNPLEATLLKASTARQAVARNEMMKALVGLRDVEGPGKSFFDRTIVPLKRTKEMPEPVIPQGFDKVSVWRNGEQLDYAVPQPIADVVKAGSKVEQDIVFRILKKGGTIFRAGTTTANLAFAIPNVVRDVSDMAVFTNQNRLMGAINPNLWKKWVTSWKSVVLKDKEYMDFLDSGAAFSTFQKNINAQERWMDASIMGKKPVTIGRVVKSPLRGFEWFNNSLEEATKLTASKEFRRMGLSEKEVAWKTRRFGGSPDYARRGTGMTTWNTLLPFLNAQVQGLTRTAAYAKKFPKMAGYAAMATAAKVAALQAYNNSWTDPDGTPSWDRITTRDAQNNFIIFLPTTQVDPETGVERRQFLKIPAGHTVNLIRAPLQALFDPRQRNGLDLFNALIQALPTSPQLKPLEDQNIVKQVGFSFAAALNPVISAPVEQAANREFYRDVPIDSRTFENIDPEERYTPRTPAAAVVAGRILGWSPQRINSFVRRTTGGVGEMAVGGASAAIEATGLGLPDRAKGYREEEGRGPGSRAVGAVADPILRRFWSGGGTSDALEQGRRELFYRTLEQAQRTKSTYNYRMANGDEDRALAMWDDPKTAGLLNMAGGLDKFSKQAGEARKSGDGAWESDVFKSAEAYIRDMTESTDPEETKREPGFDAGLVKIMRKYGYR